MTAIVRQFNAEKAESARGTIVCPKCEGTLRYACARNGRRLVIRGRCDTSNCLQFLT